MRFERIVNFSPAFDKRHPNPKKNYGVGGVNCWMILKGNKGAVQFMFSTGIYLPHVIEEWKEEGYSPEPMGFDVGYHSLEPMYDGQGPMSDKCDILDCQCYYDGSGLRAQEWFKIFMEHGSSVIWEMLEQDYKERFGEDQ